MKSNTKFNWKVFISMSLAFAFITISFTGIILYLSPAGRIAHWVNWKIFGLTKEGWQSVHTVFSLLFVILSIFHLFFMNWKLFWSYLKNKVDKGINKKREFYLSTMLTMLIFIGIIMGSVPFSWVMQYGTYLKESWENPETKAPVAHAEKLTIPQLIEQLEGYSTEQVMNRLKNNQLEINAITETIEQIGANNNISPIEIYNIITYKPGNNMAGKGIGKKPLEQLATENNQDIDIIVEKLKQKGISANKTQTLKDIAQENDMPAKDIYELIIK